MNETIYCSRVAFAPWNLVSPSKRSGFAEAGPATCRRHISLNIIRKLHRNEDRRHEIAEMKTITRSSFSWHLLLATQFDNARRFRAKVLATTISTRSPFPLKHSLHEGLGDSWTIKFWFNLFNIFYLSTMMPKMTESFFTTTKNHSDEFPTWIIKFVDLNAQQQTLRCVAYMAWKFFEFVFGVSAPPSLSSPSFSRTLTFWNILFHSKWNAWMLSDCQR